MKKIIIKYVIPAILVILISIIYYIQSSPTPVDTSKEPIKIEAEILRWEYYKNAAEADTKFKDKVLEVTGYIHEKNVYRSGTVLLDKGSDNAPAAVYCIFDKSYESQLALLSIGDELTVWGKVDRTTEKPFVYTYSVLLNNCSLSNPLP